MNKVVQRFVAAAFLPISSKKIQHRFHSTHDHPCACGFKNNIATNVPAAFDRRGRGKALITDGKIE
jgi:hypothetical protein